MVAGRSQQKGGEGLSPPLHPINVTGKTNLFLIRALAITFSLMGCVYGDTVRLTNGDVISGKILSFSDKRCVIETKYGATLQLGQDEISSLSSDKMYAALLQDGDRITGKFADTEDKNVLTISSTALGNINVPISNIQTLTRYFSREERVTSDGPKHFSVDDATPPLSFLSGSTVLLSPGKAEIEQGVLYKQSASSTSLYDVGYFQRSTYIAKSLEYSTTLRGGISTGLEAWVTVPINYTYIEQVSTNAYVREKNYTSFGDVSFGAQYLLTDESDSTPAIAATISITAPTGKKAYFDSDNSWLEPINNGSGHWSLTPGLSFVRTSDPAIIFAGFGLRYSAKATIDGYNVDPGWGVLSFIGVGFALNERLSFGSRLSYSHNSPMKVNGEKIFGSETDLVDLSLSASYRLTKDWIASPHVSVKLDNGPGSTVMGISFKKKLN